MFNYRLQLTFTHVHQKHADINEDYKQSKSACYEQLRLTIKCSTLQKEPT